MTQVAVKERGISFIAEHIPKVLDGTKTMTRRTWGLKEINKRPNDYRLVGENNLGEFVFELHLPDGTSTLKYIKCPYGQVGDGLWLKETYAVRGDGKQIMRKADYEETIKALGLPEFPIKWKSPRFMPHTASRKDLAITGLRAERLQSITEADAIAEGVEQIFWEPDEHTNKALKRVGAKPVTEPYPVGWRNYLLKADKRYRNSPPLSMFPEFYLTARGSFFSLWNLINAPRGYSRGSNPWVWAIGWKV